MLHVVTSDDAHTIYRYTYTLKGVEQISSCKTWVYQRYHQLFAFAFSSDPYAPCCRNEEFVSLGSKAGSDVLWVFAPGAFIFPAWQEHQSEHQQFLNKSGCKNLKLKLQLELTVDMNISFKEAWLYGGRGVVPKGQASARTPEAEKQGHRMTRLWWRPFNTSLPSRACHWMLFRKMLVLKALRSLRLFALFSGQLESDWDPTWCFVSWWLMRRLHWAVAMINDQALRRCCSVECCLFE